MVQLRHTPNLFAPDKAIKLAQELSDSDEDWKYTVRHDPTGIGDSLIEIRDEDDEFVGYL